MPSEPERGCGASTALKPERPRFTVCGLLVSWLVTGVALMVAAGLLPGVHVDTFWGALLVAAVSVGLAVLVGSDDTNALRIARRQGIIAGWRHRLQGASDRASTNSHRQAPSPAMAGSTS